MDRSALVYDIQFSDETGFENKLQAVKKPVEESQLSTNQWLKRQFVLKNRLNYQSHSFITINTLDRTVEQKILEDKKDLRKKYFLWVHQKPLQLKDIQGDEKPNVIICMGESDMNSYCFEKGQLKPIAE